MVDIDKVIERIKRNTSLTDDALLQELANDAVESATADGFSGAKLVIAAGWLGSHMASIISGGNSNIKKQALGPMSIEYQVSAGQSTYLDEYERMLMLLDGSYNHINFY